MEALRHGEADRAVAVGHDAPIEPQMLLYYHRVGLLASEALRPFDARARRQPVRRRRRRAGARDRGVGRARAAPPVLGEVLGGGYVVRRRRACSAIRDDGDGLARAIALALADAGLAPADVGMIVAHGNGTRQSDASEAAAIRTRLRRRAAAGDRRSSGRSAT